MGTTPTRDGLEPARPSRRFRRFFAWYSRRMFRRSFGAVRLAPGSREAFEAAARHDGPVMIAMNHCSWWDPLLGLILTEGFLGDRPAWVPMELEQLRKFAFMKRLGIFGLDPDRPDALSLLVEHARGLVREHPRSVFGITPQGAFTDVRSPVRLRPGAGAVLAACPGMITLVVACEYGFCHARRPDVFVRARIGEAAGERTVSSCHRALTRAMRENQGSLAELVMSRDEGRFGVWLGTGRSGAHPVYDAVRRAGGSGTELTPSDRGRRA